MVGAEQAPTRTRASMPARLPARAKCDDDRASLSRSVSGDLQRTANLAEVVNGVPTSGLKQKTRAAAGSNGSTPDGLSRCSSQVPRPTPPMKRRKTSSASGTQRAAPGGQVDAEISSVVAEHTKIPIGAGTVIPSTLTQFRNVAPPSVVAIASPMRATDSAHSSSASTLSTGEPSIAHEMEPTPAPSTKTRAVEPGAFVFARLSGERIDAFARWNRPEKLRAHISTLSTCLG